MFLPSRILLLSASLIFLSTGGAQASPEPIVGEFEGVYFTGFEVSNFQPCSHKERWWLLSESSEIAKEVRRDLQETADLVIANVFLKVEARVTADENKMAGFSGFAGGYGHLGMYNREIVVTRVLESREVANEDLERCTVESDRGYPSEKKLGL